MPIVMCLSPASMSTVEDSPPAVELNKNGSVSRKRLHLGNVPSIPRTEECPICAARFTRANHLKRHMLTHTDSRKHECEKCNFQFTRRDLLTKHMRICGKPKVRSCKSRRKSCIPCSSAKCKCDMKQPCAGCRSRNKECVFLECEPGPSNPASTSTRDLAPELNATLAFPPLLDPLADRTLFLNSFNSRDLVPFISSDHYSQPAFDTAFSRLPNFTRNSPSLLNTFEGIESFWDEAGVSGSRPLSINKATQHLPLKVCSFLEADSESTDDASGEISSSDMFPFVSGALDMEQCLSLCLQRFTTNVPVVHAASWVMEGKSPLLITVMQACGAAFLNSPEASKFVRFVATSVPDMLSVEMDRCPPDLNAQLNLLSAYFFLQSEGILNMQPHGWNIEATRHALIRMINRNKLVDQIAEWTHPSMTPLNFAVISEEWRRWGQYESFKRLLWGLYCFDCLSALYFGTKTNFHVSTFRVPLPCESNIWEARSPMEWFWTLGSSAKYGVFFDRFIGASIKDVLASLFLPSQPILSQNSWHLTTSIIAMTMEIRQALLDRKEARMSFFSAGYDPSRGVPVKIRFFSELMEFSTVRMMLENWLTGWAECTEVFDREDEEMKQFSCFSDLVHMYYTAHVLLSSFEKPTSDFTWTGHGTARSVKIWLSEHVPKGKKSQVVDWDGLPNVRFVNLDEATVPVELHDFCPAFKAHIHNS